MKKLSLVFIVLMGTRHVMAQILEQEVKWTAVKSSNQIIYWSSILAGGPYANCISEKNKDGSPILDHSSWAVCETENKIYTGTFKDKDNNLFVGDSDAVQACKGITNQIVDGKKLVVTLPDENAYSQAKDNGTFQGLIKQQNDWAWLASTDPVSPNVARVFRKNNDGYTYNRGKQVLVRCIGR